MAPVPWLPQQPSLITWTIKTHYSPPNGSICPLQLFLLVYSSAQVRPPTATSYLRGWLGAQTSQEQRFQFFWLPGKANSFGCVQSSLSLLDLHDESPCVTFRTCSHLCSAADSSMRSGSHRGQTDGNAGQRKFIRLGLFVKQNHLSKFSSESSPNGYCAFFSSSCVSVRFPTNTHLSFNIFLQKNICCLYSSFCINQFVYGTNGNKMCTRMFFTIKDATITM